MWYQDIKKPGQCVIHKYCQIWTQAFTHLREKSIQISTRFKSSTVCSYSEWPPITPLNKNFFVWFPTPRVSRPISAPRRRLGSMFVCPGGHSSELSTLEHPWGKLRDTLRCYLQSEFFLVAYCVCSTFKQMLTSSSQVVYVSAAHARHSVLLCCDTHLRLTFSGHHEYGWNQVLSHKLPNKYWVPC